MVADAQKVNTSDESVPHSGTRHGVSVDRIAAAAWPFGRMRTDSIWRLNVRINAFPYRFVLCALVALCLWGAPAFSQRLDRGLEVDTVHSNAKERPNVPVEHAMHDWTHDHMLYPRFGPMNRLIALQKDPRAIQHWQESYRKDYMRWRHGGEGHRSEHHNRRNMQPDWNISLGAGAFVGAATNPAVYPAKWTFDINESLTGAVGDTGACLNDYLVVPINALSGATLPPGPGQPNIIGLNNLYSGTAPGPTGVCNGGTGARTTGIGTTDDGVSATTYFSYAVLGDDGAVQTSPVTSMDGNFIAFVEGSGTGVSGTSHFHVLAWNAGDGQNAANRQDALTNAVQITTFAISTPLAAGTATDLPLNATDTLSSPFVDYTDDLAYVGDDAGNIYRIQNVFCPTWAPCGGNLPSLDLTFNASGIVNVGAACQVSGITVNGVSGNIYAGCSDGNLYSVTPDGLTVTALVVGDGNTTDGGIVDAPVLDEVNGWVYTETGSCTIILTGCAAGSPVLVQASLDLTTSVTVAALGPGGNTFNIHAPAFNDAYFTNPTASTWMLYEYASDNVGPTPPGTGTSAEIVLYGITFSATPTSHTMNATVTNVLGATTPGAVEVSPLTEFLSGGVDLLFASSYQSTVQNIVSYDITAGFPGAVDQSSTEGTGTSGIVIDNAASGTNQADSLYFGVEGTGTHQNTVVKLTQSLFQ
jgi:hypothetical protein